MKKIVFILSFAITLLLSACGDGSTFSAEGTVKDLGSQNMRVVYYSDGTQLLTVPVKDDKFEFKAEITQPTIVEFYGANKTLLGRCYVDKGDDMECSFIKNSPQRANVKGNDVSERWCKFLNDNIDVLFFLLFGEVFLLKSSGKAANGDYGCLEFVGKVIYKIVTEHFYSVKLA